jgi:hypothetical protein
MRGRRDAGAVTARPQGEVLSDRFHGRVIKSPRDMRNVLSYVLLQESKDQYAAGFIFIGCDG